MDALRRLLDGAGVGLAFWWGRPSLDPDRRWLLMSLGVVTLMAVSLAQPVWEGPADLRQVLDVFTLSWVVLLLVPRRLPVALVASTALVWLATVQARVVSI